MKHTKLIRDIGKHINLRICVTLSFFGGLYSLVSIINHYNFRTFALDLGLYTNALYKYSRLMIADSGMINARHDLLLGGHFDLYLILFSPLVYVFGTYTLLIIQISALLAGAYGVYKYISLLNTDKGNTAYFAMLFFLTFFGVFAALAFDYHSVVVATSIIPWFFYYFRLKRYVISSLLLLFTLFAQENISLLMTFICLGLLFEYRLLLKPKLWLGGFALFSAVWFLLYFYVLHPLLSSPEQASSFAYSVLGNNPGEAFILLVSKPLQSIRILFANHLGDPYCNNIKKEFLFFIALSGLWALFLKPHYLLMLLPLFLQKLFHDRCTTWGVGYQYAIEFAPIMAIGIFSMLATIKKPILKNLMILTVLLPSLFSTVMVMNSTNSATNREAICLFIPTHYKRDYSPKQVRKQLHDIIPANASVSAQSPLVPHLALREKIYQYPVIKDALYVALMPDEGTYPMRKEEYEELLQKFLTEGHWIKVYEDSIIIIFKRLKPV